MTLDINGAAVNLVLGAIRTEITARRKAQTRVLEMGTAWRGHETIIWELDAIASTISEGRYSA